MSAVESGPGTNAQCDPKVTRVTHINTHHPGQLGTAATCPRFPAVTPAFAGLIYYRVFCCCCRWVTVRSHSLILQAAGWAVISFSTHESERKVKLLQKCILRGLQPTRLLHLAEFSQAEAGVGAIASGSVPCPILR